MTPLEQRATFSLSLIVSLRMLGLMAVLPLFALSASQYTGANPSLIGLALGAYGLTQAILQMPLGMLSDRVGRKPVMAGGLLMLALGSIIAATGHSIIHLMIGRILQGAGAIGSTAIACLADLTQEENRTKAMAILGISIGLSFFLSMAFGPLLGAWVSLSGIFWCTAAFAFFAIGIIYGYLPSSPSLPQVEGLDIPSPLAGEGARRADGGCHHPQKKNTLASLKVVLSSWPLLQLNFGIFLLHAILTTSFIAIPVLLQQTLHLDMRQQWKIYLPTLLIALIVAFALIVIAEKKHRDQLIFSASIAVLCLSECLFYACHNSAITVTLGLFLFLTVFSILEAMLPSLASKIAPAENKGSALGIFSSSQFLGIFAGGAFGGLLNQHYGVNTLFLFCAVLAAIWLISKLISYSAPPFRPTGTFPRKGGRDY